MEPPAIGRRRPAGHRLRSHAHLVLKNGGLHRWIPFPVLGYTPISSTCMVMITAASWISSRIRCGTAAWRQGHVHPQQHVPLHQRPPSSFAACPACACTSGAMCSRIRSCQHVRRRTAQRRNRATTVGGSFHRTLQREHYDGSAQLGSCDFDGDNVQDSFMATGVTWWFSSGKTGPWSYRTRPRAFIRSAARRLNSDNRCDVVAGGVVFYAASSFVMASRDPSTAPSHAERPSIPIASHRINVPFVWECIGK